MMKANCVIGNKTDINNIKTNSSSTNETRFNIKHLEMSCLFVKGNSVFCTNIGKNIISLKKKERIS